MQTRMVRPPQISIDMKGVNKRITKNQLSKEDEVAGTGSDNEVRREDQDKINRFSRLHQRETVLEGVLKAKQVFPLSLVHSHACIAI